MSRTVQRKTSTVDTSAVIGQNASNLSSKPVMNQSVNVNINPVTAQTPPIDPYNAIIQEEGITPVQEKAQSPSALASQDDSMINVYKKLMNIYKNALLDDPQLTLNLIDQSGKIILRSSDLVDIIAHCCDVNKSCVKITYYVDEDITCCSIASKINPVKEIQSIQIFKNNQNLDLMINFNGVYNQINDEFKISLQRVLVSVQPIAYV